MSPERHKAQVDAQELVAQADTGARSLTGNLGTMIAAIAFFWSVFQLYVASNVPFWLNDTFGVYLIFNDSAVRNIHLAFGLVLAAFAYPLFSSSPRNTIPWYDWILAFLGAAACLYLVVMRGDLGNRAGLPTQMDLIVASTGLAVLAIAVYRSLGLPLVIVAAVFVAYAMFGNSPILPEVIQWRGASYGKAMWHYWIQEEGVFGVAIGVSASMIFLFVLFGSLLEKAGAGNYFIKAAFALLGHLRGGPAKAAVLASAMSGLYSGSSIANVVTTGTFTIPLMKRTGFPAEKAGAVEVASSVNGQLMPPVMGAAAFLIAEFTGTSYHQVVIHAFIPAVISYIALVYIVHLEALKMNLKGLPKPPVHVTILQRLIGVLTGFIGITIVGAAVYYGLGWTKTAFPSLTFPVVLALFAVGYVGLLYIAAQVPDLEVDDPNAPVKELPAAGDVGRTGYYFILPIVVLIWCILVERFSPSLSAFYATMAMIFIVVTQHPLKAFFRKESITSHIWQGVVDFVEGMTGGARNMIGIAVATAAAGIIVGTVSLTGMHQMIAALVEFLSGGNLLLMLVLVAVMSLILGMGLPTTANYLVVSSLMALVVVDLGEQTGFIVPLIAVHFFVFYFGIMADVTPPVGLAAFAAAAISRGDPIKTGVQGFIYSLRTAALPFLFIFNTDLLLIDVEPLEAVFVFVVAVVAMMLFAAATQGYFFARSRLWESVALLLIAFTLFRPGFWLDQVQDPYVTVTGPAVMQMVGDAQPGDMVRLNLSGPDFDDMDKIQTITLPLTIGDEQGAEARLNASGLVTVDMDGQLTLEEPFPGTQFAEKLQDFDFYGDVPVVILNSQVDAQRMPKELFYIPALLLLLLVVGLQRRRQIQPAF
ncbi:Sialic acid TRAP transporter permease protein SiaT [Pseudovibrio axinellae]|uniref:Sialic acid TRAP transporter permease protein SiaT n=1 Tax=Pseudovibrio axinellae TaxID=989403 RepID=A0A165SVB7_9HYPH|nr:TRAP transporter permease [Pseudovibrio axinellae]KZL04518.1 Sialic acid TRAP transporter permease protein SiaT [Pseudovibrio axinellae]SER31497.1 TRAP transporter, 4TM/12TM fusion protein [Pseudovibrio axinellae]